MKITGVAIKHGDMVVGLPKPNRHHHVIAHMVRDLGIKSPLGHDRPKGQGFYLEDGTYLDREEAREFATSGECLLMKHKMPRTVHNSEPLVEKTNHVRELFSEDLW